MPYLTPRRGTVRRVFSVRVRGVDSAGVVLREKLRRAAQFFRATFGGRCLKPTLGYVRVVSVLVVRFSRSCLSAIEVRFLGHKLQSMSLLVDIRRCCQKLYSTHTRACRTCDGWPVLVVGVASVVCMHALVRVDDVPHWWIGFRLIRPARRWFLTSKTTRPATTNDHDVKRTARRRAPECHSVPRHLRGRRLLLPYHG